LSQRVSDVTTQYCGIPECVSQPQIVEVGQPAVTCCARMVDEPLGPQHHGLIKSETVPNQAAYRTFGFSQCKC